MRFLIGVGLLEVSILACVSRMPSCTCFGFERFGFARFDA